MNPRLSFFMYRKWDFIRFSVRNACFATVFTVPFFLLHHNIHPHTLHTDSYHRLSLLSVSFRLLHACSTR